MLKTILFQYNVSLQICTSPLAWHHWILPSHSHLGDPMTAWVPSPLQRFACFLPALGQRVELLTAASVYLPAPTL